jgi:hypothetical protein
MIRVCDDAAGSRRNNKVALTVYALISSLHLSPAVRNLVVMYFNVGDFGMIRFILKHAYHLHEISDEEYQEVLDVVPDRILEHCVSIEYMQ